MPIHTYTAMRAHYLLTLVPLLATTTANMILSLGFQCGSEQRNITLSDTECRDDPSTLR